jgi:predicted GIY-YIG superfamily endonuclease
MSHFIIYECVNNLDGRRYIGLTSMDLPRRWQRHQSAAANRFHIALHESGPENFTVRELARAQDWEVASRLEKQLIYRAETRDERFGYNIHAGGKGKGEFDWLDDLG